MTDSHPLYRRFENELVVGEQVIEWTTRGHDFFFRPSGSDVRLIWCELHRDEMVAAMKEAVRLKRVQERIAKSLALKRLRRFWPLDDERELVLTLGLVLMRCEGAGFWLQMGWREALNEDVLLFEPDLSLVLSRLESTDESWALLELIQREGPLHWFQCSRGDLRELKRVLWACLTLYGGSFYSSKGADLLFQWLLHAPYNAREDRREIYDRVRTVLDTHFALKWHPLSNRTCALQGNSVKRPIVSIRPSPSLSEHERLEATLIWREFLNGKIPDEEIATLLHV